MVRKKNILDKTGALLPGYKGYVEREGRHRCDKLLRERVAARLKQCTMRLDERLNASIRHNEGVKLAVIERTRKSLDTLSDTIKYASYGESGFFADNLIKTEELNALYQMDYTLLEKVQTFSDALEDVGMDVDAMQSVIRVLDTCIKERAQWLREYK